MSNPNRVTACHHIEIQDGCNWCLVYKQQTIRQCDSCGKVVETDHVYLRTIQNYPRLICWFCEAQLGGNDENNRTGK